MDPLEERRRRGFRTTLRKIWARASIRGNDLADAAAKMPVTKYDFLPELHKLKVDVGEVLPRPPHWVMCTVGAPPFPTHVGSDTRMATLRQL